MDPLNLELSVYISERCAMQVVSVLVATNFRGNEKPVPAKGQSTKCLAGVYFHSKIARFVLDSRSYKSQSRMDTPP